MPKRLFGGVRVFKKLCFVLAIISLLSMYSHAQTTTGLVTGLVTDSSGAVVAGAEVNVTNQGTGLQRVAASGDNGIYLVPALPPGIYDVSIKKQAFATQDRPNVQLQ